MSNPLRTITVYPSIAAVESAVGPGIPHYVLPLDRPAVYKWTPGGTETADSKKVLDHSGGSNGAWTEVRFPDKGADLTDANATITVAQDVWRVIPAATLTTNRTGTLSVLQAVAGDRAEITRLDVTANTYAIINGGPAAGTLVTLPVSVRSYAKFYFDGTNWLLRESAQMPS